MDRSRGADAARLRNAVVASAARAKALQEVLAKAQRVARMAALNAADDAAQRAALAAAGVLETPGTTLPRRGRGQRGADAGGVAGGHRGAWRAAGGECAVRYAAQQRRRLSTRDHAPRNRQHAMKNTLP